MKHYFQNILAATVLLLASTAAFAATVNISFDANPEGAAVNYVVQTGPTSTGSWTTFATVPGTGTSAGKTATVAAGATICARVKTVRISDAQESGYTAAVCTTVPPLPSKTTSLTVTITITPTPVVTP